MIGQDDDDRARAEPAGALRCNLKLQRARDRIAEIDAREAAPPSPPDEPRPMLAREPAANVVYGVVTGYSRHSEQDALTRGTVTVLGFRLDRRDVSSGSAPPVPVQLRGRRVVGMLQNGDWAELPPGSHGGTVTLLTNLITGERVTSRQRVTLGTVAIALVAVSVLAWIALAFAAVVLELTPREMFDKVSDRRRLRWAVPTRSCGGLGWSSSLRTNHVNPTIF